MIMWGFPAFVCALLVSAVLLRRWPLAALAVTLGGWVAALAQDQPMRVGNLTILSVVAASAAGLEICYMAATRARRVSVTGGAMAVGASLLILRLGVPSGGIQIGSGPSVPAGSNAR